MPRSKPRAAVVEADEAGNASETSEAAGLADVDSGLAAGLLMVSLALCAWLPAAAAQAATNAAALIIVGILLMVIHY
jgi:hypothetical protein